MYREMDPYGYPPNLGLSALGTGGAMGWVEGEGLTISWSKLRWAEPARPPDCCTGRRGRQRAVHAPNYHHLLGSFVIGNRSAGMLLRYFT